MVAGAAVVSGEELRAACELAEQHRQDAAEAERRAYQAWQDSYGAYEVARDEATAAYGAYVAACPAEAAVPA